MNRNLLKFLPACAVLSLLPGLAAAQDYSRFETALRDCAGFMAARAPEDFAFEGRIVDQRRDDTSWGGSLFYSPEGGGHDYVMTFEYRKGTSLQPAQILCGGAGDNGPLWPDFIAAPDAAAAILTEAGFVEINFPGGPKGFANCGAEPPDMYAILAVRGDDRVVFSANTGDIAATYCMMGIKQ